MRSKQVITLGLIALVSMSVVACGGSSGGGSSSAGSKKHYTIAFVPGELPLPFYQAMQKGVNDEAKRQGVTIMTQAPNTFTALAQQPILSSLLARHPDGLILTPDDQTTLAPIVMQYKANHIPVITADLTLSDASLTVSQIISNNRQGGAIAADHLAKLTGARGDVGVVEIGPGVSTTLERGGGFIDEIKSKYPNMHIVTIQYNQNSETKAASVATSIILAHPKLIGLFQAAGGVGVGQAVLDTKTIGKVYATGYDSSPAETALLGQRALQADVLQKPYEEGVLAVRYMVAHLQGKPVPKVTKTGLILATADNWNEPAIQRAYYYNVYK